MSSSHGEPLPDATNRLTMARIFHTENRLHFSGHFDEFHRSGKNKEFPAFVTNVDVAWRWLKLVRDLDLSETSVASDFFIFHLFLFVKD